MNQPSADQGWQQLQAYIESLLNLHARSDMQRIENRPFTRLPRLDADAEGRRDKQEPPRTG
jgi:hypothetical protein